MINVVVADDHELVREGLRKVFLRSEDVRVIGEATDAQGVLDSLRQRKPDVLILDINLPGRSGLEVLREVAIQYRRLPVLILSMHPEERFAVRSLKLGAAGYISKDAAAKDIVDAIRRVAAGEKYVTPVVAQMLADAVEQPANVRPDELLSPRELSVLSHIAAGRTIRQIAARLSVEVNTIYTYRRRLLQKLGLHTNIELALYATENNLLS